MTSHPLKHLTTYLTRLHLHELRILKVTKSISKSTKINRIKSFYHPHLQGARGVAALSNALRKDLFLVETSIDLKNVKSAWPLGRSWETS